MGKQSSKNKYLNRRFGLGILLILINLVFLFKMLNVSIKYIGVAINVVFIIAVLVKVFDFSFTKMLVIFIIASNFLYAYKIIELVRFGSMEPNALTIAFYGFTTVQLWNMATIKNKKEETKQKEIRYGDTCEEEGDFKNYG